MTVILLRHGGFEPQIPKLRKQRAKSGGLKRGGAEGTEDTCGMEGLNADSEASEAECAKWGFEPQRHRGTEDDCGIGGFEPQRHRGKAVITSYC